MCCTALANWSMKESERIDKYLDLARRLKKLWNMRMVVVLTVVGTLGNVP